MISQLLGHTSRNVARWPYLESYSKGNHLSATISNAKRSTPQEWTLATTASGSPHRPTALHERGAAATGRSVVARVLAIAVQDRRVTPRRARSFRPCRKGSGDHWRQTMRLGRWKLVAMNAAALLLLAGSSGALYAQGTITGRVTAQGTNEPIGDARVTIIGTSAATATAQDGRYTIRNAPAGAREVRVLRVGYQEQKRAVTITAGQTATLDFSLAASVVKLQDVVTTATGEQRKVELGNAISTLGDVSNRVETSSITDLADLMVAKSPGVVVLTTTPSI
ncbi:MAG: hypothetical protein B7Z72_03065 [Gemmatimonadetes bacterium 21-71-4]|nr:MAG: hypothetical protein B7Z72_03065 [Gemmatimonadetes bacterium 21-71-4]